ncbi:MAG: alpha-mannosidase [Actinomycetota bacterium]
MTPEEVRLLEARIERAEWDRIFPALHTPTVPLAVSALHIAGEPVPVEVARAGRYEPFAVGDTWGPPWGTTWFRFDGVVPEAWPPGPVEAVIAFGASGGSNLGGPGFTAEALVWGEDGPVQGLHPDHQAVRLDAGPGDAVSLLVEAAANPDLSRGFAPTTLGDRSTAPPGLLYRLARAELGRARPEVRELRLDVQVLRDLMGRLDLGDPRRHEILRALVRALDALDPDDVVATAGPARTELADVLAAPAHASAHRVVAVGHAHIDTAWLWPLRETVRKCARTFSTAVQLLDEHPDHRFACSQAQQYAWIEERYPKLFERIRAQVAAGRFVPVGGMWVEADTNLPSGESLVRQLVHGQRYFLDRFGVECRQGWLPDVFGYPASLPQVLRQAGIEHFVTQKLSWNERNRMPHHTFEWEGLDGSRVRTHFPPVDTYNAVLLPSEQIDAARRFRDHGRTRYSLCPFGHGDGGGGPTRDMVDRARRMADLEGLPRVNVETPADFFAHSEADDPHPPVWVGELYLEKHRGTYTTQAATKARNRSAELTLREAELWSAAAALDGAPWPADELDRWWKEALTQQFHDVLPGSSIAWVHREAEEALGRVVAGAGRLRDEALGQLTGAPGDGAVLANALTHGRSEVVEVPAGLDLDGDGPRQQLADGRVAAQVEVPGLGLAPAVARDPGDEVHVAAGTMSNSALSITWGEDGLLSSVYDRVADREVLSGPGNVLQLFPDHPAAYDAWDIDGLDEQRMTELCEVDAIAVIEHGPLVGRVRIERSFGASHIVQDLVLRAGSRRIDLETSVDWHEHDVLLKAAFPVAVRAASARYEVQFGHVDRPTHRNTSWDEARFEVCAHSWVDLAEPDYGVALLNDAKYGHDVLGDVMRLSLLRAPRFPDPSADRGRHRFTYSLLPHVGDWRAGDVVAEAHRLNLPVRTAPGTLHGGPRSIVEIDHPGVVVSAVKLADDGSGDLVVRLHEAWGQRSRSALRPARSIVECLRCDLLERPTGDASVAVDDGAAQLSLRPFELVTLRLR